MTRLLSAQQVYHRMTGVFFFDDTAPVGTVATGGAKGTKTIVLTAGDVVAMSLADGDEIRIGPNGNTAEVNQVDGAPAVETVNLKLPLSRTVAVAEVFTKLAAVDLGATDENGISFETTQDETALAAGTQRQTYLFIGGSIEQLLTMALRDFNQENLAKIFGIVETDTAIVDPNGIVLNPEDFLVQSNIPWKWEGLLEGGEAVTGYNFSAKVATVNATLQFAFGTATILPLTLRPNGAASFLIE